MKHITPPNSIHRSANALLRIEFVARCGATDVRTIGSNEVEGRWAVPLKYVTSFDARNILEEFVNQPEPFSDLSESLDRRGNSITRKLWKPELVLFTQRYGALMASPEPGAQFKFAVHEFANRVMQFQKYWENFPQASRKNTSGARSAEPSHLAKNMAEQFARLKRPWDGLITPTDYPMWLLPEEGDVIWRAGGHLRYGTASLWRFLLLTLFSLRTELLRKCKRESCARPYFFARRRSQHYCSDLCAQDAQKQWKKQWWEKHGPDWRKEKRREVKDAVPTKSKKED